jgi:outer membrane protein TolC
MTKKNTLRVFLGLACCFIAFNARGQKVLTMKEALQTALDNYGTIKAKASQLNASKAYLKETKSEYLPDFNISAQQDYGTVNGQNGPLYGYRGLSVASSGPALATQNWNSAFGALYLGNINWDFFTFGRSKEKIKVQQSLVNLNETDLVQEQFQHEVRVAAAYLNLLAAQRLVKSQEDNLKRVQELTFVVVARVKNGLNAGVDSSLANADVSGAKIALTRQIDLEQEQANILAQYLGVTATDFVLDSIFVTQPPKAINQAPAAALAAHPVLKFYEDRISVSNEQAKYYKTFNYPTFSLFGVMQGRGSGFQSDINTNPGDYTRNYGSGVSPNRYNYLFGVGMVWNLTNPFRVRYQVQSQKYTSQQYKDEYDVVSQRLGAQMQLAESKISNALKNYQEAPVQVKAAGDAYLQKNTLYKNGLSNIVDLTTALYTLNRAETDRDIAYNNVWQALLYKAAATGDFNIFVNNF